MLKMEVLKRLYLEDELEDLDDKDLLDLKNAVLDGEILFRFLYDGKKYGYDNIWWNDMKCKVSIATKEDPYNILRRYEHNIGDPRPNGYYLVINYEAIVRCLVSQYRGDMIDIRYDYLVSYDRIYWFMYLIERTTDEDIHPSKFQPINNILKIGNKPVIRYDIVIREPEEDTSNV